MEIHQTCFECLEREIREDFSEKLIFKYGIFDSSSAFPFGSRAIVQIPSNGRTGSGETSPQFLLVRLPSHQHDCLTTYVDGFSVEHVEGYTEQWEDGKQSYEEYEDKEKDVGVVRGKTDVSTVEVHCLLEHGKSICQGGDRFNSSNISYSGKFSCARTITALAPVAYAGKGSYSTIENLSKKLLSKSVEDHVLSSLIHLFEGKPTGRDAENFLSLVGVPSFNENTIPGCLRHPNIAPVLGMVKTPGHMNVVLPKAPYTLENILYYCPSMLQTEWYIKLLLYQLLSAVAYLHSLGIAHGDVCPSNVMLTNSCWLWLNVFDKPHINSKQNVMYEDDSHVIPPSSLSCSTNNCPFQALYADLKLSPVIDWHSNFRRWWRGELSNYDYLLVLNRLAGRRWGDHTIHTVMPWVVDFSVKPDENSDTGWRDLRKSKWRLAKGDEQLDFTYSTSEVPHHVSDECLSELAVCSYKARRLPLSILRSAVRSVYEPNEYPSNMQRLYQWTPDECIPEFYHDPRIFTSLHPGMSDLAIPPWASSTEEFIKLHRDALESNCVSKQIHHWIDITFGYKMSGQDAVVAKNVMLPSSEPSMPRSVGRRQLFTRPHPMRQVKHTESQESILLGAADLQELEDAASFCEDAFHLSPIYYYGQGNTVKKAPSVNQQLSEYSETEISNFPAIGKYPFGLSDIGSSNLIEYFGVEDNGSLGFQELCLWKQKSSDLGLPSKDIAEDIFAIGCILAELHLKRPLFNSTSLAAYVGSGILPGSMQDLPSNVAFLVEACIQREWWRRPSAKCLLESPYFTATIRSSYMFLAPLHLLVEVEHRLQYAAKLARQGALKAMGTYTAEMCAPYCLELLLSPLPDIKAEWAYILLKEFLKCLKSPAIKALVLPAIQKILQDVDYSHLKVSLLQDSFMSEIWTKVGKQAYLQKIHPLVIASLSVSPHKNSTSAASALLMGSCEELGIPVTVHQTILPLIHSFGKGLCADGIDVLVRIGSLLGNTFIVKHILPLLRNIILSCIDVSNTDKSEPIQSWNSLAVIDSLVTLDGLVAVLPSEVVIKELVQDRKCLHVKVLMQKNLEISVLQVAATTLIEVCQHIGPDFTSLHVLPQLKELFDEFAFSKETIYNSSSSSRNLKVGSSRSNSVQVESRMDLVLLLYPSFASLIGIEKLRQCCATWLLLEQILQRSFNWKWDNSGEAPKTVSENISSQRPIFSKISTSDYSPAKMLLTGVGWSVPQSQGARGAKNGSYKQSNDHLLAQVNKHVVTPNHDKREPWIWYSSPAGSWDGPDFLARSGGSKDELPWKIRASIIHSVRAHPAALRAVAVCHNECTVFTGGVGPGFKGTVQKWELQRMECVSGYYGHEEVVNDVCVLSSSGRIASCDGTIHVWNSQTSKLISAHAEVSSTSSHSVNPLSIASRVNAEHTNMLNSNAVSGGILSSAFGGSLYTCMQYIEVVDKLIAGTGNGSLRFIDVAQNQKLHLWKSEPFESPFSSLISAVCSCGSDNVKANRVPCSSSWIAAGLSSGHCRLFDARSGSVVAFWRAHDGYITTLAAPEDHLLVSGSLDKTVRVWDLRNSSWSGPSQSNVFRGHSDGVAGFSVWGQDVISISRNKIGLCSLSRSRNDDGQQRISPQILYTADQGMRNLSVLSSISILPFSRLFLLGTEDGYLKICC
ncbi:Wd repeat domain [Thalictrum thalictroides]|uniref:Wd repeat domain n=1 Tax=Thalictrum thalictroides TaxID=46969 RepID=A0A7J6WF16_THATH|nr:Wd repeat domain [Thalictrum thalictroides]